MYRQLDFQRTEQQIALLEDFVKNAVGKPYSCSPSKLMQRVSLLDDDNKARVGEGDTFFCSELVAKVYKILGFLPNDVSSKQ